MLILAFFIYSCGSDSTTTNPNPAEKTFTVTYQANVPTGVTATPTGIPTAPVTVNSGEQATEPTPPPTLTGYTFGGWFTEANTTTAYAFSTPITANITLYAKWTPVATTTYTVTYSDNLPTEVTTTPTGIPTPVTVNSGNKATEPTPPPTLTHYTFDGWFTGTETNGTVTLATTAYVFSTPITANITLYAKWSIKTYTITYNANLPTGVTTTPTGIPTAPVTVNSGNKATEPTPPTLTNYNFLGWYAGTTTSGTLTIAETTFDFANTSITENKNLYAKWSNNPVVTFNTQGGSSIDPITITSNTQTVAKPSPNPTRQDYTFNNWYTMATDGTVVTFPIPSPITESRTIYAQWTRNTYTITYNGNKPTDAPATATLGNVPTDPATVNSGDQATAPTPPTLTHYTFDGWFTGTLASGTVTLAENTYVFSTEVTSNITLYAKWTRNTFTVTYNGNKPTDAPATATLGNVPTDPVTVNSGDQATAPNTPPTLTGYSFGGWFTGTLASGTVTLAENTYVFSTEVTSNITLYAKWLNKYTITYYGNKPSSAPATATVGNIPQEATVIQGQRATEPNTPPTLTNYNFLGWYAGTTTSGTLSLSDTVFDFSVAIAENKNLYAKWSSNPVVTFNTQGGSSIDPITITSNTQTVAKPSPDPTRQDYTFNNWYTMATDGTVVAFPIPSPITESRTIYAQWIRNTYTITYNVNKPTDAPATSVLAGLPTTNPVTVNSGDTATAPTPAPTLTHYTFDGWFTDVATTTAYVFTAPVTENKNLYAKWVRKTYTITYNGNKPTNAPATAVLAGLPTTNPVIVNSGDQATAPTPAPTLTHYTFDGWFTDVATTTAYVFTAPVTENKNLYAKWVRKTYTITYNGNKPTDAPATAALAGLPTTNPVTINSGDQATAPTPAPTLTHYTFDGWFIGTVAIGTVTLAENAYAFSTLVRENKTLYAKWVRNTYTITYNGNKPTNAPATAVLTGLPTTNPVTINSGDQTTAPAIPPTLTGYNFAGWYTEESATNEFDFVNTAITTDITLYAKWTSNPVVTFNTQGGSSIDPITINSNTQTVARPSPNPTRQDYTFKNWYTMATDGTVVTFPITAPISASRTIYAQWTRNTYTITYNGNKPTDAPATAVLAGLPTTNPVIVNSGDPATAPTPAPTLTHYTFDGWFIGTVAIGTVTLAENAYAFSTLVRENKTLYAKWVRNTYTITYNGNKPTNAPATAVLTGLPTTNPVTINSGDQTTAPAIPPTLTGYNFAGWYTEESATNEFDFVNTAITTDITLYAKWTSNPVVTFNTQGGSSIDPITINSNTQTVARPSPNPTRQDYTFKNWYTMATDGTVVTFPITAPISASRTIYAQWTRNTYTITYNGNKPTDAPATAVLAGLPTTNPVTINSGDMATVPTQIPILTGYGFKKWVQGTAPQTGTAPTLESNAFDFTNTPIRENKHLYATWRPRPTTKRELLNIINPLIAADPNADLNHIDTSLIEDMSSLFSRKSTFNGNISEWNVSKVQNMSSMFYLARAFNGNISEWNVSMVINMEDMFYLASAFNQPLNNWNVSKVADMGYMFSLAIAFNQPLNNWNVSEVTNMNSMFRSARDFNQPLNSWNVSMVTNMEDMFFFATSFNGNISNWRLPELTNMNKMFKGATAFNQNIDAWSIPASVSKTDAFTDSGLANSLPTWARP